MITVGVIGCGKIALERHIPAIIKNRHLQLVSVSDISTDNMNNACKSAGNSSVSSFIDYIELLKNKPDYVLLAVPPHIRHEIIDSCIKYKVNVLSEKPLSTNPDTALRMINKMKNAGLVFGIVHNYIFYPEYKLAKDLISSGAIGTLRHITMNFMGMNNNGGISSYNPSWRVSPDFSGGGILMDMIHTVYLSEFFFSDEIKAVQAVIENKDNPDFSVEDTAFVTLKFNSGYSVINLWWGNGPGGLLFSGTEGRIIINYRDYNTGPFDYLENIILVNKHGSRKYLPRTENCDDLGFELIHEKMRIKLKSEIENYFLSADSGYKSLLAVDAAYKSAKSGRVVNLDFSELGDY